MCRSRIYLSPPSVGSSEIERVVEALESGWVAPVGPELTGFEADICSEVGARGAVALASGTAGIHLGLRALGVREGDTVVCPTLTFGATAFAIVHAGAEPIFVDAEPTSWNLDPQLLKDVLTEMARNGNLPSAIVTVDLFGRTSDYDNLVEVSNHFEVPLLSDAAESLGATHHGKSAGSFGHAAVFSFNGNKIITTSGGGMLVSDDLDLIDRVRFWSTQSREDYPWYEHNEIGFNYRMSNILAALGRAQLARLPEIINHRRQIREWYRKYLASSELIQVMGDPPWGQSNCWLTTVLFSSDAAASTSEAARSALEAENIEARPVWKPMHQQPVFARADRHLTGCGDRIFQRGLCLPSGTALQEAEVELISRVVTSAVGDRA